MSGFRDDVISILKTNNLYHGEALGWIMTASSDADTRELLKHLLDKGFPVVGRKDKVVLNYDYIIMSSLNVTVRKMLDAMSSISNLGLVIMQIDDAYPYEDVYKGNKFYSTKVRYQDRDYIVIHAGVDYGN